MTTFEEIFQKVKSLECPSSDERRSVEWCNDQKTIAVARQIDGRVEVFIVAPEILSNSHLLTRHLEFNKWKSKDGSEFSANRLVFPSLDHFDQVAAFVVEELIRNCVNFDLLRAFRDTEAVIEMALRRAALSEELVLGLFGELRLLECLLRNATTAQQRASCLSSWKGYERTSRDFTFSNGKSVEVKTTRAAGSTHHINSLAQIDPKRGAQGDPEEQLFLFSVGVQSDDLPESVSLPEQVDRILGLLGDSIVPGSRSEIQESFLQSLAQYGSPNGPSYEHDRMRTSPAYCVPMLITFERAYDMSDDRMRILRQQEVSDLVHIKSGSISYTIDLPDQIDGDLNPHTDVINFAKRLLDI